MIVGNGNIAKVLSDRDDLIFFASGVSDSSCIDEKQYQREIDLIRSMPKKHIVYFSNLGIYRWSNRYIEHKKFMECIVKNEFPSYTIVRVEVLSWVKNETTIQNVFRRKIKNNEAVEIQNTHRYVLDLNEFLYWISLIKSGVNNEMNILGKKYHVCDIYKMVLDGDL